MIDVDKLTKETLGKGGVLALLYFDLHGSSKDMVQSLGVGFVDKILKEPGVIYALGEINEPLEKEKLFSTSLEVKLLAKDFATLAKLCADHSPFSIEILRPDRLELPVEKAHELLVHLSNTTYEYKKYILERVAKPEEAERYKQSLKNKLEIGRKLLQMKEGKKDGA